MVGHAVVPETRAAVGRHGDSGDTRRWAIDHDCQVKAAREHVEVQAGRLSVPAGAHPACAKDAAAAVDVAAAAVLAGAVAVVVAASAAADEAGASGAVLGVVEGRPEAAETSSTCFAPVQ